MRICRYDGNLEILRAAFRVLFEYDEIDEDMWKKIVELGQAPSVPDMVHSLNSYSKVRCMYEKSDGEFGFTEEFFAGDKWFADGVTSLCTVGILIGGDNYCLVKGYDKDYDLFTVSYIDERDISDVTVPALTDEPGDFVVGVPGLVGTYSYAVILMKRQEEN